MPAAAARSTSASSLRAFLPLLVPLLVWVGAVLGGPWLLLPLVLLFVLVPLGDAWLARKPVPAPPLGKGAAEVAIRLVAPAQALLLAWALPLAGSGRLPAVEWLLFAIAAGVSSGAVGISAAHELLHRTGRLDRALAELLMVSVGYPHYTLEHRLGHHRRVGLPEDPATARVGEGFWSFLPRAVGGGLRSAWELETARVERLGIRPWSLRDRRLRQPLLLVLLWMFAARLGGPGAVLFLWLQGAVAVVLLEAVNYLEHYGLVRDRDAGGRAEPVAAAHSWSGEHPLANAFLFHLEYHADHHLDARRPYHELRHLPEAPRLPADYALMSLLALVPPLWRRLMDRRVVAAMDRSGRAEASAADA